MDPTGNVPVITESIKTLYGYKYKDRDDSLTDQYSRYFMMRTMLVGSLVTGLLWFTDDIHCVVPARLAGKHMGKFSGQACWINGIYVFEELRDAIDCSGYYGIPSSMRHNGTLESGLCQTCTVLTKTNRSNCKPMRKKFYYQYQWYPCFLAGLSLLYCFPYYLLFPLANKDLKELKKKVEEKDADVECLLQTYFSTYNPASNGRCSSLQCSLMPFPLFSNAVIKILYVLVNVSVFLLCDSTLNGDFKFFGMNWLAWSRLPNNIDYVQPRQFVNAAEFLLPTFGFCDVLELWQDIKHSVSNEHKLICEMSQHVLYQYVCVMLWYLIIVGIAVSLIGVITTLMEYAAFGFGFLKSVREQEICGLVTTRQKEYLRYIRNHNPDLFSTIIKSLIQRSPNWKHKRPGVTIASS